MNKAELLELEANAHLTLGELREKRPELAQPLIKGLERRVRTQALTRLAGSSDTLRGLVGHRAAVTLDPRTEHLSLRAAVLADVKRAVAADERLSKNAELAKELAALEKAVPRGRPPESAPEATLADALGLREPIAFHPGLRKELDAARLHRLSDAVALDDAAVKTLIADVGRIGDLTDERLTSLAKDGKLTEAQARAAGAAATLYHVLDERPELVAAVRDLGGDPRALVRLDDAAWATRIRASKTHPPGGLTADAYGALLRKKLEKLFPTDALAHRLSTVADGPDAAHTRTVGRFLADNADVLGADLTPGGSGLGRLTFASGASADDRARVLATARSYQRVLAVTDDLDATVTVVAAGFRSAVALAQLRADEVAARTGLAPDVAVRTWTRAREIAAGVTAHLGNVLDVVNGGFGDLAVGNVGAEALGHLEDLPGFAELFGEQGACLCAHCRSILGPAAYFVDLMRFVDDQVTRRVFTGALAGHALALRSRRPDLWTLPLTCEHTDTAIPYLVIVTEILENAVARHAGFTGDVADRAAVAAAVYVATLPARTDSFAQPFHLAFEELSTYLRHFSTTTAELGEAARLSGDALVRMRLGLAPEAFALVVQPQLDAAFLGRIYGGVTLAENSGVLARIEAQRLLAPMGVTRDQLGALLATRFVSDGGAVAIRIKASKRGSASVQPDVEHVEGATFAALDRLHRFVRLWRATGGTIGGLDLVLTHLRDAGHGADLDAAMLGALARVRRVERTHGVASEDAVALWSALPQLATAEAAVSRFDRLFNAPRFVAAGGTWPQPGMRVLHPALAATPPAAVDPAFERLRAGLGVPEEELRQLIVGLATPLGVDLTAADDAARAVAMTVDNLTLLHRHAHLCRLLGLAPHELFTFAGLTPGMTAPHVASLDDLERLLAHHVWWRASRWTLADLGALTGPQGLDALPATFPAERRAFIAAQLAAFGITDLAQIPPAALPRLDRYRTLIERAVTRGPTEPAAVEAALAAFDPATGFAAANPDVLAVMAGADRAVVHALLALSLPATPFEALDALNRAADLATRIGAAPLLLAGSVAYDDLVAAALAVRAAMRAAHPDEPAWQAQIEPFDDALLARRRDGLVAYLVHSGPVQFDEVNDLYHYYLVDVQLDGCARTSRVAAAIHAVQLYVQRCLLNLEETPTGAAPAVHVLPSLIPADEWTWRQNYRVWEANRKIFLYPENYLEPALRGDKTPLFVALEEELLGSDITEEAILEAYARYLRGFDELAHLTIAGSYHEKDAAARRDVLHLVGVTADDPPVYYYRRVEDAHFGVAADDRATHWGAWEKLDVQIPVRRVAPIIHDGQLLVFWIRYVSKAINRVKDGESKFVGYQHRAYVELTRRKLDGGWTTPQRVRLEEAPFKAGTFPGSYQDDGVVLDPIVPKDSQSVELLFFDFTVYSNYEPLYDDRAHEVPRDDYAPSGFAWDRLYPSTGDELNLRGVNFQLWSPVDLYKLTIGPRHEITDPADTGVPWLNPALLVIIWALSGGRFDLTSLLPPRLVWSRNQGGSRALHAAPSGLPCFDTYSYASLLVDEARFTGYRRPLAAVDPAGGAGVWTGPQWDEVVTDYLADRLTGPRIADAPAGAALDVVNGAVGDIVLHTARDAFYLQAEARGDGKYHLRRLNTSISEDIASILSTKGLDALLATATQLALAEQPTGISLVASRVHDATATGTLDFRGPMGTYLREIFLHIPFLIANHLNSQGRFEDAQRWYHRIFDPTAAETITIPAGLPADEQWRRRLDRVWRYREFRGLGPQTLRAQLTDERAIAAYRRAPFDPHAIAQLRLSAYQKAIVMKYVDNLLDLGDHRFARAFTESNPERLREATLIYVLAQDILGQRPAQLGGCGEGPLEPKTFATMAPHLAGDSDFLLELESVVAVRHRVGVLAGASRGLVAVDAGAAATAAATIYPGKAPVDPPLLPAVPRTTPAGIRSLRAAAVPAVRERVGRFTIADALVSKRERPARTPLRDSIIADLLAPDRGWSPGWGLDWVRQRSALFCVPANDRLHGAWDRVEDRLYKLRHCLDLDGVPRQLPIFAPPIDPGVLTGGGASGVDRDEAGVPGTVIPPFRFRYLLDKARMFAAAVQSLGGALLAAIEKRDAEELARLRNVHQKNVLALTADVRRHELAAAEESLAAVERRALAATYRKDYYRELLDTGLLANEDRQRTAHQTGAVLKGVAGTLDTLAGISHLLPQLGSPFAMKYGGLELGASATAWSHVMLQAASVADAAGAAYGLEASFERRVQGWQHQRDLAEHDLAVIARERAVAEKRRAIAARGVELHDQASAQLDEVMQLFADKFTGLGLFTYLSRSLQQLHRAAYDNAFALARMAEQAYRFERPEDPGAAPLTSTWDATRAGLLAGEHLLLALTTLERRFIEQHPRLAEINQSFSLAQLDPRALIALRESGRCDFALPELYFDLFYPGHYRRRIRAVRLSIPCITGPYTNVGAKLTLRHSQMRALPVIGAAGLADVPPARTTTIATSTAQGDGGVFELHFRDERYLPFEGAGAISAWRLELPASFRPFDYRTINDVILNLSYTAEDDAGLRVHMESAQAAAEGTLLQALTTGTLTRVLSLRQEFSNAFHRLLQAAAGTAVTIDVGERHFPLFLQGRPLVVAGAHLVLVSRSAAGAAAFTVNGVAVTGFPAPVEPPAGAFGGLAAQDITAAFSAGLKRQHALVVTAPGDLAAPPAPGGPLLDGDLLQDVLLVIDYRL